jgi:hypothetical protein
MCFSANASFTSGALLLGLGVLAWKATRDPRERPFAAIPFVFGIQQIIEGVIWLTFDHEAPLLKTAMTYAFSFFSHVLWPAYLPIAVLLIEPPGWRRQALIALVALGVGVSAWLMYNTVVSGIFSRVSGQHIEYVARHAFAIPATTAYALSTCMSLLLSTHVAVKVFGMLAFLALIAAETFYATWFVSVWCYFAAVMSAIVLLHFKHFNVRVLSPTHS